MPGPSAITTVSGVYFTAVRYDAATAQLVLDLPGGHQHIYKNVTADEASIILSDRDTAGRIAAHLAHKKIDGKGEFTAT